MNLECRYCSKLLKSENSHRNHERCCPENPERFLPVNGFKKGQKARNQYIKARELGLPKPELSEEERKKRSLRALGRKHSEATKQILSDKAKQNNLGGHTSKKRIEYNGVILHSSYETEVALDLDRNGIKWTRPGPLLWRDLNKEEHRYYADFYLPEYDVYLDPKNDFLIEHINPAFGITDREKIKNVEAQNSVRIVILDKNNLTWNKIQALIV